MVRTYKKKGKYGQYNPDVIDTAVTAVRNKLMFVREASKQFGIPPTTIHNWVQNKVIYIANLWKIESMILNGLFRVLKRLEFDAIFFNLLEIWYRFQICSQF